MHYPPIADWQITKFFLARFNCLQKRKTNDHGHPGLVATSIRGWHLQLVTSGKSEKIRYVAVNVSEKWSDPEEKVRAAYYAELIYRYGSRPSASASR